MSTRACAGARRPFARFAFAAALLFSLLAQLSGARADILVIAPHPDDDIITSAGLTARARAAGETVWVMYMTNGDVAGYMSGLTREDEAVAAQAQLGVPEDHLIFLGYPDGFIQDLHGPYFASNTARTGSSGLNTTFGDRGLGHMDYHRFLTGASAANNGTNLRNDIASVLSTYRPNHIFVTSEFDEHPDHSTTYEFLIDALAVAVSSSPSYNPTVHKTIVWNDTSNQAAWPAAPNPAVNFTEPPNLLSRTGLVWTQRESLEVPLAAQLMPALVNIKAKAINAHQTQGGYTGSANGYISAFLHLDEFFWPAQAQGANRPPVPNAGSDATASAGQNVQLNGSASFDPDGTALSYSWRQVDGPTVTLSSTTAAQPTFTVPAGTTSPTAFSFELKVNDGVLTSVADAVKVLVNTTTVPLPAGSNVGVIATATASSQSNNQEASKAIDGNTNGFTPDAPSNSAYEWASNDQGVGAWIQLNWAQAQTIDHVRLFDRPNVDDNALAGTLTFSSGASVAVGALPNTGGLTVNFSARSVTWVRFTVNQVGANTYSVGLSEFEAYSTSGGTTPPANQAPSASVGADQNVLGGALVSLSGSGTDPEGASLTYSWSQVSGPSVTLSNPNVANPTFVAPAATTSAQVLDFRLVVSDGSLSSTNNPQTRVTVAAAAVPTNLPPVANAGADQVALANRLITLNGTASSDPEGAALIYTWSQVSGPAVSLSATNIASPSFVAPAYTTSAQTMVFRLLVSDGTQSSAVADDVNVTLSASNLALGTTASASSQSNSNQGANKAIDGFKDSSTGHEWISNNQRTGAWIQLNWSTARTINQVRLYDRPSSLQNITGGTLTFSSGASVSVPALPTNGSVLNVAVSSRSVTWVRFTVTGVSALTSAAGLAEMEVFDTNAPPTANAGADKNATGGSAVSLTGSGTDPENTALTYAWAQISGPSVTLSGSGASRTFTAPAATSVAQVLKFRLTVNDTAGAIAVDDILVTVPASGTPPANQAPTANAGANQNVAGGASVTLSGSGTDPEGAALSYTWSQVSGPSVTLAGSAASRTFTAPAAISTVQTLVFQLIVNDGSLASTPAQTTVTVAASVPVNQAPTANAGANQNVAGGTSVTLSGSGTDPEGAALSYAWSQVSGPSVTLAGSGASRTFTAPDAISTVQTLVFQLIVNDGSLSSTPAQTTVTVAATTPPPAGGTNLALSSTATASTAGTSQPADKVRDGFTDGYPTNAAHEWASNGQGVGAWVQLTWASAQTLNQVRLYDRPNTDDRVMAGTLTFSTGASVAVGSLDNAGAALTVSFTSRSVTWVRFTVTQVTSSTYNVGLAEFEAYNSDAPVPNGVPTANAGTNQSVAQGATVTLNGSASSDPEGAALTYDWAQTSGPAVLTVDNVANPTFVAPSGSTSDVVLTFELVVSDGPNTSTPATTTVTVLASGTPPPPSSTNFALTATATASTQEVNQSAAKAIDGFTDGYPTNETHEWSTQGQSTGAWLQLTWSSAQTITQVVLYDRPNADDNVLSGTLTFSNGASVPVGALPNTSGSLTVNFSSRSVTWVRFTVNSVTANTYNVGLSEIQVH